MSTNDLKVTESGDTRTPAALRRHGSFLHRFQLEIRMFVVLVALSVVLSLVSSHFFSLGNLFNLMDQSVVTGIAAIGQTFVILVAGIDLSVGALTGVAGIVLGLALTSAGLPVPVAIAGAIIVGGLMGLVS
jgi:ribose transport system permease protein